MSTLVIDSSSTCLISSFCLNITHRVHPHKFTSISSSLKISTYFSWCYHGVNVNPKYVPYTPRQHVAPTLATTATNPPPLYPRQPHASLNETCAKFFQMSDSFADLWNTSAPLSAKPKPQNLTLAARSAEERKRQRHPVNTLQSSSSHKAQTDVSHAAWAGLDSLDSGSIKVKVDDVDDDWGLKDFGSTAAVKSDSNPKSTSTSTSTSKTLWDLDDFASPTPPISISPLSPQSRPISRPTSRISHQSSSTSSSQIHQQKVDSPDMHFDFGSREDQDDDVATNSQTTLKSSTLLHLLDNDIDHDNLMGGSGNHEDEEEDILGMLNKPVEVVIAKKVFLFLL